MKRYLKDILGALFQCVNWLNFYTEKGRWKYDEDFNTTLILVRHLHGLLPTTLAHFCRPVCSYHRTVETPSPEPDKYLRENGDIPIVPHARHHDRYLRWHEQSL